MLLPIDTHFKLNSRKMSELNDDLLNDELDEELDDQALLGADEDELLLSDEELETDVSIETKSKLKNDAEQWVSLQLNAAGAIKPPQHDKKKVDDDVTTSTCKYVACEISQKADEIGVNVESNVTTSEESQKGSYSNKVEIQIESTNFQTKNDEVTSTNKEIEDQSVTQTGDNSSFENTCGIGVALDGITSEVVQFSQESASATGEICLDPREEDQEERGERTNIKQIVERSDKLESSPDKFHHGRYFHKRGRGGMGHRSAHYPMIRPPVRYPHGNFQQFMPHPNENINPQTPSQYFPYNPIDPMNNRPQFPQSNIIGPRTEYRSAMTPGYRNQNPSDFTIYRSPRAEYPSHDSNVPFNSFTPQNTMRNLYRPDANMTMNPQRFEVRPRMPAQRPPGIPLQGNPPYIPTPITTGPAQPPPGIAPLPGGMPLSGIAAGSGQATSIIPRKVLINPNFKGGVEAVKNQLMKDTQFMQTIGPHVSHLQSDEELLRQQEEFINKNRMHIEKRRHERSPERRRSRERSYSPIRRERRGDSRERRDGSRLRRRRAGSRDFDARDTPKRRAMSPSKRPTKDKLEEEDEETRAYRLEIEKQKAMREKILKDKEMRRRKAIEGKQVDEKLVSDEPPQKLTPVVVTGSKIISLKKKQGDAASQAIIRSTKSDGTPVQQQQIQKQIPTAKILPETKRTLIDHAVKDASTGTSTASLAVIKPVVKKTITVQTDISKEDILDDDELLEEELLLADTPSPPPSPKTIRTVGVTLSERSTSHNSTCNAFTSSNRRVVLKPSKELDSSEMRKGIFDRLEKKIGVNESVKRKIQRIVIKNAE